MKKKGKKVSLFVGCLFALYAFASNTYYAVNDYGISESTNIEVLAQTGTTGSGTTGGGSGGTGGGTPIVIPPCVGKTGDLGPMSPVKDGEYTRTAEITCQGEKGKSCTAGDMLYSFYVGNPKPFSSEHINKTTGKCE